MKIIPLWFFLFCTLLDGCAGSGLAAMKPEVDVEIVNKSSCNLGNAKAYFGDYVCEWGSVIVSTRKGFGFYPHPITPQTELHWDEAGGHRVEKIDLSKIYPPGKSGRLTFTVYDGRVEATFRPQP